MLPAGARSRGISAEERSLSEWRLIELGQEPVVRPTISCIESLPPTTSVSELRTPTYIAVQHERISNAHRADSWASISVVDSNPTTCVYIRPSGVILILTLDLRTYHSPTDLQIFAHAFHTRSLHRWQLRNELWRLWVIECRFKLAFVLIWTRACRILNETPSVSDPWLRSLMSSLLPDTPQGAGNVQSGETATQV